MELIIQGKNVEISDWLRRYVEKKIGKLDRYLNDIIEARVELAVEKTRSAQDRQVAQVTVKTKRALLRAEEKSSDLFASIDAVADKIHRQIARYKEKRTSKARGQQLGVLLAEEAEEPRRIVRVKRFQVSPMDEEEAIEQMELLGHDFFIFYNVETGSLNVLYRRKDGNYGLIQPELA